MVITGLTGRLLLVVYCSGQVFELLSELVVLTVCKLVSACLPQRLIFADADSLGCQITTKAVLFSTDSYLYQPRALLKPLELYHMLESLLHFDFAENPSPVTKQP